MVDTKMPYSFRTVPFGLPTLPTTGTPVPTSIVASQGGAGQLRQGRIRRNWTNFPAAP